jgi:hypothetical protein
MCRGDVCTGLTIRKATDMSTRPAPKVPNRVFVTGANGFVARGLATRLNTGPAT